MTHIGRETRHLLKHIQANIKGLSRSDLASVFRDIPEAELDAYLSMLCRRGLVVACSRHYGKASKPPGLFYFPPLGSPNTVDRDNERPSSCRRSIKSSSSAT